MKTIKDIRPYYHHFVAEISCPFKESDSVDWLKAKTESLLTKLKVSKLETVHHHFEPQGISLVYILSASHVAVHTWPENGYIHIDLISCQTDIGFDDFKNAIDLVFSDFQRNSIRLDY